MSCIIESAKQRAVETAEALGLSLPPLMNQYCQGCNTFHIIDLSDVCDQRYGRAPVDLPKREKLETWYRREYCHVCHAYHNRDGVCGGARDVQEWADKPMK